MILCALLVASLPSYPPAPAVGVDLEITILQGDGATHFVNYSDFETPAVRVTAGGQPLKGVQVTFQLPDFGPSGSFQGKRTSFVTNTGNDGGAEAKSFRPNRELGVYTLRVTVVQGGRSASVELRQTNAFSRLVAKSKPGAGAQAAEVAVGVVIGAAQVVAAIAAGLAGLRF